MPAIYPHNLEQKIGFDKIRQFLTRNCLSSLGQEHVSSFTFSNNFDKIQKETQQVVEFVTILNNYDSFPTSHYFDLRGSLKKLNALGSYIETFELFDLKRSLESMIAIVNFFNEERSKQLPNLSALAGTMATYPGIVSRINQMVTKSGDIKDNASPELADIRSQMRSLQNSVSKRMNSIIRKLQSEGLVDEDVQVSLRDGRPVIPVSAGLKKRVSGIIHDESATGKTSFIEPTEIVEVNNKIRELINQEKREIIKILIQFSDSIRPQADEISESYLTLGLFDFIRSKAIFARNFECHKPAIESEPCFDWYNAKHPLLMETLKAENREVVPLNMRLMDDNRILLISGPNAGGKSVCLKTVGLIQYLMQCGMLVPLTEGSKMGVFNQIFIDIGDEQSMENDLSTYSSHLMNMKQFVNFGDKNTLVLIDEFGTGTEPALGGAIAEAVLNKLNKNKVFGVITTHYTNLKHFATSNVGIVNGAMLYDHHKMQPLFKLQVGKPGSSFAFEIARKIGLPEELLTEATEKVGEDHIHFDKHLREIMRDKQYWENKRRNIRKAERRIEELSDEYTSELTETDKLRKSIIQEAKQEAKRIVDGANKVIENTIRDIKESQAEKEKTIKARKDVEKFKASFDKEEQNRKDVINKKIEKLKQKENKIKKQKKRDETVQKPTVAKVIPFQSGDKVRVKASQAVAEIIDIDKKKVVLAIGNLISNTTIDKIEHISNNAAKKLIKDDKRSQQSSNIGNKVFGSKLEFKPDIDVRGQRGDEAVQNIQQFIDEAIVVGASRVRILHGTGHGILRQMIREYLRTELAVKSAKDEHVQMGGAGITVVELSI